MSLSGFESFTNLDLTAITLKLKKQNPTWDQSRLTASVEEYRKWLYLCKIKKRSDGTLGMAATPGSRDVDEVWHTHILFTRKYAEDCNNLFGYFLHHQPTEESTGRNDESSSYANTLKLYRTTFKSESPTWFSGIIQKDDCRECVSTSCQPPPESDCGGCSGNCHGIGGCSANCNND